MGKPHTHKPAAATEAVITITAVPDVKHEIEAISWSLDDDPAAGVLLTVESPASTVLQQWLVTKGGPGFIPFSGSCIKSPTANAAMIVRLASAGGSIVGTVNAIQRMA